MTAIRRQFFIHVIQKYCVGIKQDKISREFSLRVLHIPAEEFEIIRQDAFSSGYTSYSMYDLNDFLDCLQRRICVPHNIFNSVLKDADIQVGEIITIRAKCEEYLTLIKMHANEYLIADTNWKINWKSYITIDSEDELGIGKTILGKEITNFAFLEPSRAIRVYDELHTDSIYAVYVPQEIWTLYNKAREEVVNGLNPAIYDELNDLYLHAGLSTAVLICILNSIIRNLEK